MRTSAFEPCIPTRATKVPTSHSWLHEIKHDGYRLIVRSDGKRVRLFTRSGFDWSDRYPLITEAALRIGRPRLSWMVRPFCWMLMESQNFDGLHSSRKHNDEVQLYAFDILVTHGDDLRRLPLTMRKTNLARLLARRVDGIFISDFERGEIGPELFRHACLMGLEGLVSKLDDQPYQPGRPPNWVKINNPASSCRG
ncbi:DNA ligase [Bradyrhizobium sp. OAE829]|uniref:ATP-dependent DNA ligase n=1 Tax=Bradyrhizobium sp. OAE829 TaxID=2663807 RepID=UPI00178962E5